MRRIAIFAVPLATLTLIPAVFACSMMVMIWEMSGKSADPVFRFVRNKRVGYIDASGKIVIKPSLPHRGNYSGEFHEGLLDVEDERGSRLIDRTGATVAVSEASYVDRFSEGLAGAWPAGKSGTMGFIDRSGKFAIAPQFSRVGSFSEGLAMVDVSLKPAKVGYINREGKYAIEPVLSWGGDFHEGIAVVVRDGGCKVGNAGSCNRAEFVPAIAGTNPDCRFSYIDKTGRPIFDQRFDDAQDFSEELAAVRVGHKWGYVNKRGEMVIAPQFDYAHTFSEGLAAVRQGQVRGFIDHSGKVVITLQDGWAESFSDGRALTWKMDSRGQSTYWYIDKSGVRAFPGDFDFATSFVHGRAHVKYRSEDKPAGAFAWIDPSGTVVFTYSER